MKKLVAMVCATVMAFALAVPAFASSDEDPFALTPQADILDLIEDATPSGQIILGSSTQVDENMMSGWTNSATNQMIKILINGGYDTIVWTKDNGFIVNPISVKEWNSELNEDGSKTYTFQIYDNLVYNTGDPITAADYCFSMLFSYSPEMQELDATYSGYEVYVGGEDYFNGDADVFSGLHLIDDYTFSLTIAADQLPNFNEFADAAIGPMAMHVIAPEVTVEDDGEGCYLSEGFTAELLQETINNVETGYRYAPLVTSGPYQFVSYDPQTLTAVITINPLYLGNYDGTTPRIKDLIFKYVYSGTEIDELKAGSIDILSGQGGAERINQGLDLVDEGGFAYGTYPRNGFGYIRFHCDFGPTQFQAVRQAITLCLDRDEFCRQYTGGYGIVVSSYYGQSQWEYQLKKDELDSQLNPYTKDLDEANRLLDEDGWVLDESGDEYVAGEGKIRHKMVDGELMPLVIEWCSTDPNPVSSLIEVMLPAEAEKIGMKINRNVMEFTELLANVGRENGAEPAYHMFNLALGFGIPTEYWYTWSTDPYYMGGNWNQSFLADEELYDIALAMKATDPSDTEGWADKWVQFMVRFNELMPMIPLYSDMYHDFYTDKLHGYEGASTWNYYYAIQRAYVE